MRSAPQIIRDRLSWLASATAINLLLFATAYVAGEARGSPRVGTAIGQMSSPRSFAAMARLPNGKILIAGGDNGTTPIAEAELYDPTTGRWMPTASMSTLRSYAAVTTLNDGRVLVVGGYNNRTCGPCGQNSAELYNPSTASWTLAGTMSVARASATATTLNDGRVLVAGGWNGGPADLASAEIYDPSNGIWNTT